MIIYRETRFIFLEPSFAGESREKVEFRAPKYEMEGTNDIENQKIIKEEQLAKEIVLEALGIKYFDFGLTSQRCTAMCLAVAALEEQQDKNSAVIDSTTPGSEEFAAAMQRSRETEAKLMFLTEMINRIKYPKKGR